MSHTRLVLWTGDGRVHARCAKRGQPPFKRAPRGAGAQQLPRLAHAHLRAAHGLEQLVAPVGLPEGREAEAHAREGRREQLLGLGVGLGLG